MKCVRNFHTELKESSPELAAEVCRSLKPGDWDYIKVYQSKCTLQLCWKEPYQVLVITNTAVMCKGYSTGSMLCSIEGSHHLQKQHRVSHLSQQSWMIWINFLWSNVNRSTTYNPANRLWWSYCYNLNLLIVFKNFRFVCSGILYLSLYYYWSYANL